MNPAYWIPLGLLACLFYLFYVLTIDFKLARLDDAVAEPETDVHNDLTIWGYAYYDPRVKARKLRALFRWVGVSAVTMLVCWLFAGGGQSVVHALALPTPTQTPTPTSTPTLTPTVTPTPTITNTPTPQLETVTPSPTASPVVIYQPGPTGQVQQVIVTRVVQVPVQVKVTQIIYKLVTPPPGPTQTPWIIYVTQGPTSTETASPTSTETASPTPSETPTETASPTPTESPTPTPTLTPTQETSS